MTEGHEAADDRDPLAAPIEDEVRGALAALRRTESARPTDRVWADITDDGRNTRVEQNRNTRILGVAAAIVLAVATFAAGLAIGGRGGTEPATGGALQVGGTPPGDAAAPRYLHDDEVLMALSHEVLVEGLLSAAWMTDQSLVGADELAVQRAATDAAIAAWQGLGSRSATSDVAESTQRLETRRQNLPVLRRSVDGLQTDPDQAAQLYAAMAVDGVETVLNLLQAESTARSAIRMLGVANLAESEIDAAQEFALMLVAVSDPASASEGSVLFEEVEAAKNAKEQGIDGFIRFSSIPAKQAQRDAFANDRALDVEKRFFQSILDASRNGTPITGLPTAAQVLAGGRWALDAYEATIAAVLPTLGIEAAASSPDPAPTGCTIEPDQPNNATCTTIPSESGIVTTAPASSLDSPVPSTSAPDLPATVSEPSPPGATRPGPSVG